MSIKSLVSRKKLLVLLPVVILLLLGAGLLLRYTIWVNKVNACMDSIWAGKFKVAEKQARDALLQMSVLPDAKSFALNLRLLVSLFACRRQFNQAESYARRLLEYDRKTWGEISPEYAGDLTEIALMKRKQSCFAGSERLYKRAIETFKKCPGHEVETARNQALLGWVLFQQGKESEALEQINESDSAMQKLFSASHFERLVALVEAAYILRQKQDKQGAAAAELKGSAAGAEENESSAAAKYKESRDLAFRIITEPQALKASSAQTVVVLNLLAQMLAEDGRKEDALRVFEIAESNCKASVFAGTYNTYMADILEPHARLLRKLGREQEATALERQAKEIREIKFP